MDQLGLILLVLLGVLVGIAIGIFIGVDRMKTGIEDCSVGHLRIDRSEPDEAPRPFLEITTGSIESIARKEYIVLKVINENYLSRD
jgi:hypothetical protein